MKFRYIFILFFIVVTACTTEGDKALVGKWKINEFTTIMVNRKTSVRDAQELKDGGAVWDVHFKSSGKFRQDFNMHDPSMKMKTETGTWTTKQDTLFIQLESTIDGEQIPPLRYTYKFNDEQLVLTMAGPRNMGKLITKFVK